MFIKLKGKIIIFIFTFIGVFFVNNLFAGESAGEVYKKGLDYLTEEKFDKAIKELSKAIEMEPGFDLAYYDRGRAYDRKGDYDRALSDYTKAIEFSSIYTIQGAYNNRGFIYERMGDYDRALSDYTKGIEAVPKPEFSGYRFFKTVLLYNRAKIYLFKGECDKAWEDVHDIEKLNGKIAPEFIEKLKACSSGESPIDSPLFLYKDSPEILEKGNEFVFFNNRGYDSYKEGNYEQAIMDYDRAIKISPDNVLGYVNRANSYAGKEDWKSAITDYMKALEITPGDDKIYHDLGVALFKSGDTDKAISYYNKALEINPELVNSAQFYNDRAVMRFFREEYEQCWADVNKALELGYEVHSDFIKALKKAAPRNE